MRVQLVASTRFEPPADVPWQTDADGGDALAEFAGRACYESWDKPKPATATNATFLRHLLEVGHLSVLEHATATFYVTGVSRALSHEVARHRHFSVSELSPRHALDTVVVPAVVAGDPELAQLFDEATASAQAAHARLLAGLADRLGPAGGKQARQAARGVLPEAAETHLVVTGNYRALRHFVAMRASEHADVELRQLSISLLRELQRVAPHAFADFVVSALPDGTEVAASPLVGEG